MARDFTIASSQSIDFGNVTELVSASNFTYAAWMKRTVSNEFVFLGKGGTASTEMFLTPFSDGNIYVAVKNGSNPFASVANNSLDWQRLAMVFDGSLTQVDRVKLYINGVLQSITGTKTWPTTSHSGTTPFYAGFRDSDNTFAGGNVAEVKVWDKSLTASELLSDYYGGYLARTNLKLCSPLGYGSPEPDYSGSGYAGTLSNGPTIADHPPIKPQFGADLDFSPYGRFGFFTLCSGGGWWSRWIIINTKK